MTGLIIFLLLIAIAYKPCAKYNEKQKKETERKVREEIERQKSETQALLRRQHEVEREQARQRAEQERLAKEQERQAAQLAKHEERIAKMEFALEKANYDIAFLQDRIANLKEQIEYTDKIRREAKPGSKQDREAVNHIMTLQNQLHTANVRLGKARFDKEQAEKFLRDDAA